MSAFAGKNIVLGVSGGIAAYKACELASRLTQAGARVFVVMTANACQFVSPLTFESLTGNPAVHDTFARPATWEVEHIALAKRADLFLIVPATANVLAKLACGIADDMLTTTVLACRAPMLAAPAMNTVMWEAAVTQQNVQTLLGRGWQMVGPGSGQLACGDVGAGRMSEPAEIIAACQQLFAKRQDYAGRRVLVTAGPTREALDPVRFLSNRSSGKMGYAIAQALVARGAAVTLISGPVALTPPAGATVVNILSTQDLLQAVMAHLDGQDMVIQAAAPADFTAASVSAQKIKKQPDGGLTLQLVQTPDVARQVGAARQPHQVLIGFAAETENGLANARRKLADKNLDMIALNDVTAPGAGFDVDTNVLQLITAQEHIQLPLLNKRQAADALLDHALALFAGHERA